MDENATPIESTAPDYIEITTVIISAYVANNRVPVGEVPALIAATHAALTGLTRAAATAEPTVEKPTPAQIRKSITHEALISFEDGKPYRTLRRHLTLRGLSPDAYRVKWGLAKDYPMTAAAYSERRSELARANRLGQARRKRTEAGPVPEPAPTEKPKRAGRPRKAGAPV